MLLFQMVVMIFFLQYIPLMQVDIGSGLRINSCAWSHIQGHQKDSLFVKDLLLGIWPKEQLKNRSLQGMLLFYRFFFL